MLCACRHIGVVRQIATWRLRSESTDHPASIPISTISRGIPAATLHGSSTRDSAATSQLSKSSFAKRRLLESAPLSSLPSWSAEVGMTEGASTVVLPSQLSKPEYRNARLLSYSVAR